ncbi:hypothetical protein BKI52_45015 [marine bacterium AO1-C]|nr:hypothetical protein BKI52_45015 [marine bacterium AO1-C]
MMKFKKGDCLGIDCGNNNFVGAIITRVYKGKDGMFYDLTLIEFYDESMPIITDFLEGRYFGTRYGSPEDVSFAVDVKMMATSYLDQYKGIELITSLSILAEIEITGYSYTSNIKELLDDYAEEIAIRLNKSNLAEDHPELGFNGTHLIDIKTILAY